LEAIFIYLAVILGVAFIVAYIARVFNQPIIVGYILAGMAVSPFILELTTSAETISIFSELGIAFLLFIVGLHLNPKVIKQVGTSALFIGLAQMAITFIIGLVTAYYILSFGFIPSIYIGIALMFSSTIITMKLISDKKQLDSLYAKISIGILIIQDLAAIACLMVISSLSTNSSNIWQGIARNLLGGAGLLVALLLVGFFVVPRLTKRIARSQELLFLFAICWCFVCAALFAFFGFSLEIGALVAGVILSTSPYNAEISAKIRPLRDFFLIIFFIILGLNVPILGIKAIILNVLILSAIVLILKPVILIMLMSAFGYTKRTNFQVGTTLGQISEFSVIVLLLGASLGFISSNIVSTIALTLVITIILSTYMMMYSNKAYEKLRRVVGFFERKSVKRERRIHKKYDAILFGYNRIGFGILRSLKKIKKNYLVVDFNPDTIANLNKLNIPSLYGDVYDNDLLEELPLEAISLAVSTVPDFETNRLLIESIRLVNPEAIIIVRAHQIDEALELYKKGASYVLTPHFLGGEYVANMIKSKKIQPKGYKEEKEDHIKMLEDIKQRGIEESHPRYEKG